MRISQTMQLSRAFYLICDTEYARFLSNEDPDLRRETDRNGWFNEWHDVYHDRTNYASVTKKQCPYDMATEVESRFGAYFGGKNPRFVLVRFYARFDSLTGAGSDVQFECVVLDGNGNLLDSWKQCYNGPLEDCEDIQEVHLPYRIRIGQYSPRDCLCAWNEVFAVSALHIISEWP